MNLSYPDGQPDPALKTKSSRYKVQSTLFFFLFPLPLVSSLKDQDMIFGAIAMFWNP